MQTQDYIKLEDEYGAHNYHPLDVVIDEGGGGVGLRCRGRKYLDCLSAYSAVNQGHRHPKIMPRLVEQAAGDADLAGVPQRPAPAPATRSCTSSPATTWPCP